LPTLNASADSAERMIQTNDFMVRYCYSARDNVMLAPTVWFRSMRRVLHGCQRKPKNRNAIASCSRSLVELATLIVGTRWDDHSQELSRTLVENPRGASLLAALRFSLLSITYCNMWVKLQGRENAKKLIQRGRPLQNHRVKRVTIAIKMKCKVDTEWNCMHILCECCYFFCIHHDGSVVSYRLLWLQLFVLIILVDQGKPQNRAQKRSSKVNMEHREMDVLVEAHPKKQSKLWEWYMPCHLYCGWWFFPKQAAARMVSDIHLPFSAYFQSGDGDLSPRILGADCIGPTIRIRIQIQLSMI
jgi:hypothetical protein